MKMEIEFPEIPQDIDKQKEKLIKEFFEKVIIPLHDFFEKYTFCGSCNSIRNLVDLSQSKYEKNEIAWGAIYDPLGDSEEAAVNVSFLLNGEAEIYFKERQHREIGTWSEIIQKMISTAADYLKQIKICEAEIEKISKAVKVLEED